MAPSTKSGWTGISRATASCAMARAPTWGPLPWTISRRRSASSRATAASATPRARSSWPAKSPSPAGARALPPIASTTVSATLRHLPSDGVPGDAFVLLGGCAGPTRDAGSYLPHTPWVHGERRAGPRAPPHRIAGRTSVAKIEGMKPEAGQELYDVSEKVFPDIKAEPGEEAWIFMHTVPYEGSVGLVNLLTATRLGRKGFKVSLVLYGPGVLLASGTRASPPAGQEPRPGHT